MLTIPINVKSKEPIYEQIYKYIREEIKNGSIACGTKLPSERGLAVHLEVSRNTVDMAYGQLLSEGYIEAKPKRGYFVCNLENLYIEEKDVKAVWKNQEGRAENKDLKKDAVKGTEYKIDFSPSGVDMEYFPYGKWRKLMKECLIDDNRELFLSGENQGDLSLRAAVQQYLYQSRGVKCGVEQIVIGAGSDYMLLLLSRIFNHKCVVGMENPGYRQACTIFKSVGYDVVPVSVDDKGMKTEALEGIYANLAYVTPSHHFPVGTVMSASRKQRLLAWASKEEERYIIEDDYDSEFRYFGKPIPALQSQDPFGKVIYLGTLSKAIAPGIRLSFMVLPWKLVEQYKSEAGFYFSTVSRIDQKVISEFLIQGHFERHLNRMRKIYRGKHDILMQALKDSKMPFKVAGDSAGLHVMLQLPEKCENALYVERMLVQMAKKQGVKVYPLSDYYMKEEERHPSVLVGFARLTEIEITEGIRLLKEAWGVDINQKFNLQDTGKMVY
ncbi:MAG: PLP-dependent aminotransferase family protein [Lachnospiraceae bacterium]|nr:PLP-dependent aminotransferase family protein [Lachnospiraceae bacterium]